ncbi:MAG: DUF2164 family protein [bacterium]
MAKVKREFDLLTKEEREKAVNDIISFYITERNEEMDIIGASNILDAFLQDIAPKVYNKALDDAKKAFKKQAEEIDFEMGLLKK